MFHRQIALHNQPLLGHQIARPFVARSSPPRWTIFTVCAAPNEKRKEEPSLGLKAAWGAAEAYGNLTGGKRSSGQPKQQKKSISRKDAIASIKADYAEYYFVSGKGELAAYDANCLFKDDFASFNGVERFKNNVSNLGNLTEDVKLDVTNWDEREDSLKAKWRFSAILKLPWRPRLAAAGATTYVFDQQTGLVVEHIEEWDVEASKVIKALLKPASKPTNDTERFMYNLATGDWLAAWYTISNRAILPSGAVIGAIALARKFGGEPFQGLLVDALGIVAWAVFGTAFLTETIKVALGKDDDRPK